ncbi:hypothetical protein CMI41_00750 [Candidatus Pacearchaeota archaeon]|nr:hypothetical protein [Candidatus Pacearchaeota archaeon]|tara:strand:+ start:10421 stop:10690 length:270 start_codon:yes stop_codon:yes gene_type:complete
MIRIDNVVIDKSPAEKYIASRTNFNERSGRFHIPAEACFALIRNGKEGRYDGIVIFNSGLPEEFRHSRSQSSIDVSYWQDTDKTTFRCF